MGSSVQPQTVVGPGVATWLGCWRPLARLGFQSWLSGHHHTSETFELEHPSAALLILIEQEV